MSLQNPHFIDVVGDWVLVEQSLRLGVFREGLFFHPQREFLEVYLYLVSSTIEQLDSVERNEVRTTPVLHQRELQTVDLRKFLHLLALDFLVNHSEEILFLYCLVQIILQLRISPRVLPHLHLAVFSPGKHFVVLFVGVFVLDFLSEEVVLERR